MLLPSISVILGDGTEYQLRTEVRTKTRPKHHGVRATTTFSELLNDIKMFSAASMEMIESPVRSFIGSVRVDCLLQALLGNLFSHRMSMVIAMRNIKLMSQIY